MKRLKLFVCTLLLSVIVFSVPVNAYNPQTDVQYENWSPFYIESGLPNFKNITGDMMTYVLRTTPTELWDLYTQEGVRIYVTQSVPQSERTFNNGFFDGVCYGATLSWNGAGKITKVSAPVSIYIYSNAFRADTYYHECGHALDDIAEYITGYYKGQNPISHSNEWISLYNAYAPIMATFDSNAACNVPRNNEEGFAEAYRLYFSYPGQLQARCPEVYTFVQGQISKYTAYVPPLTYDNFNYLSYATMYDDLRAAYGYDKNALWDHYVNCGKAEGRIANRIIKVKR